MTADSTFTHLLADGEGSDLDRLEAWLGSRCIARRLARGAFAARWPGSPEDLAFYVARAHPNVALLTTEWDGVQGLRHDLSASDFLSFRGNCPDGWVSAPHDSAMPAPQPECTAPLSLAPGAIKSISPAEPGILPPLPERQVVLLTLNDGTPATLDAFDAHAQSAGALRLCSHSWALPAPFNQPGYVSTMLARRPFGVVPAVWQGLSKPAEAHGMGMPVTELADLMNRELA